ncbi:MAG: hypothetical protein JJ900_08120 [Rhodospirillales bacterium]|nr:hypothetical protein [Rhodospirillales bacterium]MBO6786803.1 hypothetical protein [Rhodospirillales bacterium]
MRIDQPPATLDLRRLDVGPPLRDGADGQDKGSDIARHNESRALVAYRDGTGRDIDAPPRTEGVHDALIARKVEQLAPPAGGPRVPDVRYMTPREMQDYSQNLYAAGVISFEDYEALAFQPDLHPDFARTIGALTGEKPQPDRPRDYIRQWSDRVEYTQRYYPQNSNEVRQAHRIHEALNAFPRRTDIFV